MIKFLRVIKATVEGFSRDLCFLHASALTYYTLLSIVPLLAVAFGIATGFGFETVLEAHLQERFPEHNEVVDYSIKFAYTMLEQTKKGPIAGIGAIVLFWSVIGLLNNIEVSFNEIWKVKTTRSFLRKCGDYLSVIVIAPIFFTISSSLTVYITTQLHDYFLHVIPLLLIWMLFSFFYLFIPNRDVPFKYGVSSALISASAFLGLQWSYVYIQILLSRYNAIYGSFAALPLFLIWVQISWLIVLAGAELAYQMERQTLR